MCMNDSNWLMHQTWATIPGFETDSVVASPSKASTVTVFALVPLDATTKNMNN